ncbi:hypothetical protein SETIT_3G047400v2 [Setaria italica]|uniref:Cupin type-1 domain-containing protein n=1 Tax=Setaria italica TaxID=4555 RepID=K3Z6D5_SETIT|nr:glutelin type-B 5 [Setaria italica]RCV15305.1 hypothetical protein SETIT_3G047400v2 [Setaria italica]
MAPTACFCLCIGLLLWQSSRQLGAAAAASSSGSGSGGCEFAFDMLHPLDPIRKIRSEAGTVDYFDEANQQLLCAGAFFIPVVIDYRGLVLPRYANGGVLALAQQGTGIVGWTFPGCPEAYQKFRQGDVIALRPGVPHWFYNDGGNNEPLELIMFYDINTNSNQLQPQHKDFTFAGSNSNRSRNIFKGLTTKSISQSLEINQDLATRLQGPSNDTRGTIVRVPNGLRLRLAAQLNLNTTTATQLQDEEHETGQAQPGRQSKTLLPDNRYLNCLMKVIMNLEDPHSRRITRLTGDSFPILNSLGLSVERGTLKPNEIVSPYYTINAQTVVYVTGGSARLQVVDNRGVAVLNDALRQGQLLVIPQYYVVLIEAGQDAGFEYVAFKTNANPLISRIAGPGSVLRGLPVGVIAASYNFSTADAIKIKNSRGNDERAV